MTSISLRNPFLTLKVRYLVGWTISLSLVFGFALGLVWGLLELPPDDEVVVLLIYILLFTSLSGWLWQEIMRQGGRMALVLGKFPDHPRWLAMVGLVLATLLFSMGSFQLVFYPLSLVAPSLVESVLNEVNQSMEPQTVVPWLYNGLNLVATLVVAPITEELLFRGFILQRWAVKWNLPLALILSSVLFGLMHPNPVGLTVFGLLMGVLYIKTRSLLVAIACHALNNGLAVILEAMPKISQAELITLAQLQSGLGASVLMVAISAPFLFRFITKNFPRRDAPIPYLVNQFQA